MYHSRITPELRCMLLLRRLQQQNRFVTFDLDFPLSISQTFTMLEVAAGRNKASDLSELFNLDQSTVSRNLAVLARDKYLKLADDPLDARKKIIKLAAKGQKFIEKYNKLSEKQIQHYSQLMSKEKLLEFEKLFSAFNDGLSCPKLQGHSGDSIIRREMRRVVFGLNAFSQSFMDSGLNIAEWQLLSELVYKSKSLSQTEISESTGISKGSLPAIVARLSRRKLIQLKLKETDNRSRNLQATSTAARLISKAESAFCEKIQPGLKNIHEPEQFLKLLELFIAENHLGYIMLADDLYGRRSSVHEELDELRSKMLHQLAEKKLLHQVPSILFDRSSEVWVVCDSNNTVKGGIELKNIEGSITVQNILLPEGYESAKILKNLLKNY